MTTDPVEDLLQVCQLYVTEQVTLLHALRDGVDREAIHQAAQAQLDQLMTALGQARAHHPRRAGRTRPGDPGE
jgi:predicted glycoside hydrolase/deacetylase ChbG (UPF0249 family)